jgi:putative glutamine amidotransferase
MGKKPVIGITGPSFGGFSSFFFISIAVIFSGGIPRWITPLKPLKDKKIDGLILSGGSDIDPLFYDLKPENIILDPSDLPRTKHTRFFIYLMFQALIIFRWIFSTKKRLKTDKKRDNLEYFVLNKADKSDIPVLGICRGSQLINLYYKGSLHPEITDFYEEYPMIRTLLPKKDIIVNSDSMLYKILNKKNLKVNSLHHQSVKQPGKCLKISAFEPNKVVQGIEHDSNRFILGVQWHPEYLLYEKSQRKLFTRLVKESRKRLKKS